MLVYWAPHISGTTLMGGNKSAAINNDKTDTSANNCDLTGVIATSDRFERSNSVNKRWYRPTNLQVQTGNGNFQITQLTSNDF